MSYEQAASELPKVGVRLSQAADRYSTAYEEARLALSRCYRVLASEGAQVSRLRSQHGQLRAIVDRGPETKRVLELGTREDPSLTEGQRDGAIEEGVEVKTHQDVLLNMVELIGGLARISGRSEEHVLAAAKFRSLWERAQIGGAKAIDYSLARVDSSGAGDDRTDIIGADARREYQDAVQKLGLLNSSIVERVVIHDMSLRNVAIAMGSSGGQMRRRAKHQLFEALGELADHFGVRAGAGGKPRPRKWNDGQERAFYVDLSPKVPG